MRNVALSRGYAIRYEDAGQGAPVVLVPGFMQSASDFRHAGYVDRLADRWRVLAVDPLGHGSSDKPHDPEAYRSPGVAADVTSVLDAVGLERAVMWGYSRGAWLATMTAIEFPSRLNGLIVGGAGLTDPPPTRLPHWVDPLSRGDWAAFWPLFGMALNAETKAHFERVNDPKALAAERLGRIESAYTFDLSRVTVPSLVYCGGDDEPEGAAPTAEALHTELRVIEGRDHPGAFNDLDGVMAVVVPFLETITSKRVAPTGTGQNPG